MKRRHGINTSHTKHLTNNQQLQQQQSTEQTQPPQIQQQSTAENPLSIPQTESTTVQVNINFYLLRAVCFTLRMAKNFQIIQYFTYIDINKNDKLKHSR